MRALITVSGIQGIAGDDTDTIELVTEGYYTRSENGFEMYYLESDLTGLAGTATRVEVEPDCVTVERSGTLNARMVFIPGQKSSFLYDTQFGSATLEVETKKINARLDDFGGEICIDYTVNMEHTVSSKNKLKISVKEQR